MKLGGPRPVGRSRRGGGLLAGVLTAVAILGGGLGLVVLYHSGRSTSPTLRATLSVTEALGRGPADGFARAFAPRAFAFPVDHGPHPPFRTEWWYWTGNLRAPAGDGGIRRFGFQLTIFRTALAPSVAPRRSAWAARDVYMAHLALTDVAAGRFHARDRWARGALDLSGATGNPVRVWVGDWTVEGAGPEGLPIRLRAGDDDLRIDLTLGSVKPPVLHGERGLSRKSDEPGNASYYYSLTRMPAGGEVRLGGRAFPVEGLAWMDREWSTSALGPDQVGWDWFALQLDDGREVMVYRLRRKDGGIDPASQGTIVAADGVARRLERDAVEVHTLGHWTSPRGRTRYPAEWRLRIPALGLELTVIPLLADQELDLAVRYWEGAVRVEGTADGRPLGGAGYVELVGYATPAEGGGEAVRQ